MNAPGAPPPPDWESIFHQARRRMLGKLLVVGVVAGLGTMLLLGGGLQAEGAVSLPIPILNRGHNHDSDHQTQKHEEHKHHHHHEKEDHQRNNRKERHEKQSNDGKDKHHPKKCREKEEDSSEEQYGRWDGGMDATGSKCPTP